MMLYASAPKPQTHVSIMQPSVQAPEPEALVSNSVSRMTTVTVMAITVAATEAKAARANVNHYSYMTHRLNIPKP